eukprot:SAG11_NODE_8986_length_956_cov_1.053676_1_plen_56_part_10
MLAFVQQIFPDSARSYWGLVQLDGAQNEPAEFFIDGCTNAGALISMEERQSWLRSP